ncbi:MAG: winged helix-turn-helix domain-containing protein [Terrimesophilobacter sp.]
MKPRVPLLSPLLRSDTQGRMLAALYLHPDREWTATELAREAGVSLPTILRDIDRLTTAGFVLQRTSGRNRYLRVNTSHPIFSAVADVVRHSYGPLAVIPEILADVPGIEEAYLFGSWAARYEGQSGADPNDIDVVAIGNPDRMTIYEAAAAATARLGREVNIRAVNRGDWEDEGDLFVRTIKNGALVAVPLPGEAT